MKNNKGFVLSTYVYMLLVFFLLMLTVMLSVLGNSKLLANKMKEGVVWQREIIMKFLV